MQVCVGFPPPAGLGCVACAVRVGRRWSLLAFPSAIDEVALRRVDCSPCRRLGGRIRDACVHTSVSMGNSIKKQFRELKDHGQLFRDILVL